MKEQITLKGKVAIVTGAATGIGEATAHKFASLGARVVCAGLPGDPVDDVVSTIKRRGGKAVGFEGDLSRPDTAADCVSCAVDTFRKLDILVNNAGVYLVSDKTEKVTDDGFERTLRNNVATVFYMTRAALPELHKTRGILLATGSVAGLRGEPDNAVYGGTKAFIHAFMQGVASEQAPRGVRVNCVLPGAIETAMTRLSPAGGKPPAADDMVSGIPMRRMGTPEEIANAFAFLASDLATYVHGALLVVDGGYTIGWGEVEDVPAGLRRKPKGTLAGALKHSVMRPRNRRAFSKRR
jgi:NAD(P)-dependent dehydrogenase (short-subunit alcohol dehydrogenase family)